MDTTKELKRFCAKKNERMSKTLRHVNHTGHILWSSDIKAAAWTYTDDIASTCRDQKLPDINRIITEAGNPKMTEFDEESADIFRDAVRRIVSTGYENITISTNDFFELSGCRKNVKISGIAKIAINVKNAGQDDVVNVEYKYLNRAFVLFGDSKFSLAIIGENKFEKCLLLKSCKWNVIMVGFFI